MNRRTATSQRAFLAQVGPWTGALLLMAGGCDWRPAPKQVPLPLEEPAPLETVVGRFNANAEKMPTGVMLSSQGVRVQAGFFDEEGREHVFDGEGRLLFAKPRMFYLPLQHGLAGNIVEIGSDGERYWLWFKERQTVWWGSYKYIDRPKIREMPIRADQLIEALGLSSLPTGSGWLQGPLIEVVKYPLPHYLLSYFRKDDGTLRYDRRYGLSRVSPYLLERIEFFDTHGRQSCEATLRDPRTVDVQDEAIPGEGPTMPYSIWLRWPKSNAYFRMIVNRPRIRPLSERLRKQWYTMNPPTGWRVIQIDEEYDRPTSTKPRPEPTATAPAESTDEAPVVPEPVPAVQEEPPAGPPEPTSEPE